MTEESSLTLYKLMIMYMLDNVEYPLTNSQLSEFFVTSQYTSYFHLQQAIHELEDSSYISAQQTRNTTRYTLTEDGRAAVNLFHSKMSLDIKEHIVDYLIDNHYALKKESEVLADYYPYKKGEYIVNLQIREKGTPLLSLDLNVVSESQASAICNNWRKNSDEVYSAIMDKLLIE